MKKTNSKIILTEYADSRSMSFYQMIRETIHGLDKLIVTVIYQSVTIITGCLTLSILLFEKIENRAHAPCLSVILVIIAFLITRNSQNRIKFYTNLMGENIKLAEELENLLFFHNSIKITHRIEKKVKYAGKKGEQIFRKSIIVFYIIEAFLVMCLLYNSFPLYIKKLLIIVLKIWILLIL